MKKAVSFIKSAISYMEGTTIFTICVFLYFVLSVVLIPVIGSFFMSAAWVLLILLGIVLGYFILHFVWDAISDIIHSCKYAKMDNDEKYATPGVITKNLLASEGWKTIRASLLKAEENEVVEHIESNFCAESYKTHYRATLPCKKHVELDIYNSFWSLVIRDGNTGKITSYNNNL